jgi:hypothetical protein
MWLLAGELTREEVEAANGFLDVAGVTVGFSW